MPSLALDRYEQSFDTGVVRAERADLGHLADLAERVRPPALAGEHVLPVLPPLEVLLPGGLQRGTTVGVTGVRRGVGATSLSLAVASAASASGSWIAAVGLPSLGLLAAAELGLGLERLAMVAAPPDARSYATVVATLVDAFDIVLLGRAQRLRPSDCRRVVARARERGTVLVAVGGAPGLDADVVLSVVAAEWEGVGRGHGHLQARRMVVEASGRRAAARTRRAELWLPAADGSLAAVEPVAPVVPLREVG